LISSKLNLLPREFIISKIKASGRVAGGRFLLAKPWSAVLCTAFWRNCESHSRYSHDTNATSRHMLRQVSAIIAPKGGAEHRTPRLRKQKKGWQVEGFCLRSLGVRCSAPPSGAIVRAILATATTPMPLRVTC